MVVARNLEPVVRRAAESMPAVVVVGPRQSGKSTMCRRMFASHRYVNLEAPDDRAFAMEDPRGFLSRLTGDAKSSGVILDEIQRAPSLLSYLQPLIDEDPRSGRWVLTGSQHLLVMQSVSQSLAGRATIHRLLPLTWDEVQRFGTPPASLDEAMFAGGYPRIHDQRLDPSQWLGGYVDTYVERDVRTLSNVGDLTTFQRFLGICAGRTSQLLNASSLASDVGVSQPTAKAWVSILETGFIVQTIAPWFANIGKRLIKSPKLHLVDTGLACWLLGIRSAEQIASHPLRGMLFETWAAMEIVKHRANRGERAGVHHYRDAQRHEADVVVENGPDLAIVEAKASATITREMTARLEAVVRIVGASAAHRPRPVLVYGGDESRLQSGVDIVAWRDLHSRMW